MTKFTDSKGRVWSLGLDITVIKKVRAAIGVDLHKLTGEACRPLGELVRDQIKFTEAVYHLAQVQPGAEQVSEEDFCSGISGDVLSPMTEAFIEAVIAFVPDPEQRAAVRKLIDAGKNYASAMLARAHEQLDGFDAKKVANEAFTRAIEVGANEAEATPAE